MMGRVVLVDLVGGEEAVLAEVEEAIIVAEMPLMMSVVESMAGGAIMVGEAGIEEGEGEGMTEKAL